MFGEKRRGAKDACATIGVAESARRSLVLSVRRGVQQPLISRGIEPESRWRLSHWLCFCVALVLINVSPGAAPASLASFCAVCVLLPPPARCAAPSDGSEARPRAAAKPESLSVRANPIITALAESSKFLETWPASRAWVAMKMPRKSGWFASLSSPQFSPVQSSSATCSATVVYPTRIPFLCLSSSHESRPSSPSPVSSPCFARAPVSVSATLVTVLALLLLADCVPMGTGHPQQPTPRIVTTKYGSLRGAIVNVGKNLKAVEVYLGVPYATPPKGSLRFMPPVTPPPWRGVRTADQFGPVCPQRLPDVSNETDSEMRMPKARLEFLKRILPSLQNQSEDCLNLNIYTPLKAGREGLRLPVMVYIHGESFEWNSGNPYDGSVLASYGELVIVTINYRLGVLGFLSTESDKVRGNYGLLDQVAALHWIQENIQEFGGDPRNVTLFGHDYGAACANFLMISPVTKGLFQRVILLSGSALAHWALVREPLKYALQLATVLECPTRERDDIVKCLRGMPVEDILEVGVVAPDHLTAFGPTIDGTVIPSDPEKLMQSASHAGETNNGPAFDLLFGVTNTEGSFPFGQEEFVNGFETDKRERITRTFVHNIYTYHMNEILAVLTNEYTDWTKPMQHPINIRDATMEMLGDAQYVAPLVHAGIFHSMANSNTYFYVFDYKPKKGENKQRFFHGEEIPYIFGVPIVDGLSFFQRNYTRSERALAEAVIRLWANFAKTGDPNDPDRQKAAHNNRNNKNRFSREIWPKFEHVHQKYLSIDTRPKVRHHYRAHKLSVWLRLIPEIHRVGGGTSSIQHHLLDNHDDPSTFEGRVRPLPFPWPTLALPAHVPSPSSPLIGGNTTDRARPTSSAGEQNLTPGPANANGIIGGAMDGNRIGHGRDSLKNGTDPLRVETVQPGSYSTALSVTIAVGCSLLILNVLIFAGVYYQRDKNRIQAKLQDRAAYQTKKESGGGSGGICVGLGGDDHHLHHPGTGLLPPPLPQHQQQHQHQQQQHHQQQQQHHVGASPQRQPPPRTPPPSPITKARQLQDYVDSPGLTTSVVSTLPRKPGIENAPPESQPLLLQNPPVWPLPRKPNMQEVRV